ncbi:GNAT family N-acetyltransferase, partial [Amaricoccus sp. HAR-UPW-R2A-40]
MTFRIHPAETPEDVEDARRLFRAYVDSLGIDLGFQDVETELATLPGKYAPPGGAILLARDAGGRAVGCG